MACPGREGLDSTLLLVEQSTSSTLPKLPGHEKCADTSPCRLFAASGIPVNEMSLYDGIEEVSNGTPGSEA